MTVHGPGRSPAVSLAPCVACLSTAIIPRVLCLTRNRRFFSPTLDGPLYPKPLPLAVTKSGCGNPLPRYNPCHTMILEALMMIVGCVLLHRDCTPPFFFCFHHYIRPCVCRKSTRFFLYMHRRLPWSSGTTTPCYAMGKCLFHPR